MKNRQVLLDPYMRMRMSDRPSYAPRVELGEIMVGGTVGEIVESRSPLLAPGDLVTGPLRWQLYGVVPAQRLRRIDRPIVPLSAYLGVLGMPAITAWIGLHLVGPVQAGKTLVVSAASGACWKCRRKNRAAAWRARSASQAVRKNAGLLNTILASLPASITKSATFPARYGQPRPTASTWILKMWAVRSSTPCWACSTRLPESHCVVRSPNTAHQCLM